MPLALLAAMPPIIAVSIEAGSGPILRPSGASARLAIAPITPGCSVIDCASSAIRSLRQPSPSSTSTESLRAWPDRLVPAARNVTGVAARVQHCSTRRTSSSLSTTTTSSGTRR